jgi:LacI family transcriptional regulator
VPEQVSIVGVDNSLLAVDAMRTPVSSVDTNLELVGYLGAQLLGELMAGKRVAKEPQRIPPAGLIARHSSDLLAISHPGVARALRHLADHFHEPIGVDDLVRVAAMSRRGLHQAFMTQIGRPPGSELQRIRIERAKTLLASTREKLEVIASQCGYQSANSFWFAFKQATQFSPKAYREKFSRTQTN